MNLKYLPPLGYYDRVEHACLGEFTTMPEVQITSAGINSLNCILQEAGTIVTIYSLARSLKYYIESAIINIQTFKTRNFIKN